MPYQTEIATLYTHHAVSAFAKQHILSFFNGKYLLPIAKQPNAQADILSGSLEFPNGFTATAQYIGHFGQDGIWQWAWADNTLPKSVRQDALWLKTYGRQHNIALFGQEKVVLNWQQQQHLAAIAAVLCGADGFHIDKNKPSGTGSSIFTLRHPELAAYGQNDSQGFHSHIIAEFAHYHEYIDKRLAYREAIAAYLTQYGYDIRQSGTELSARRGDDALHYVFDENGRAPDWYTFQNQQPGSPLLSDIKKPLPQMRLYPKAEHIFTPEQAWLDKHFLPCFTLDLAAVRPEWAGTEIHMLLPCEPEEGLIGETTEAAHTEFCTTNWLAFRLDKHNRYEFLAGEEFFQVACEPDNACLAEHIREQQHSFARLRSERMQNPQAYEIVLINHLGGKIQESNWASDLTLPTAFTGATNTDCYNPDKNQGRKLLEQNIAGKDEIRITYQGKPFYFIASTSAWNWAEYGADDILLFYQPENRMVLMTFDYS